MIRSLIDYPNNKTASQCNGYTYLIQSTCMHMYIHVHITVCQHMLNFHYALNICIYIREIHFKWHSRKDKNHGLTHLRMKMKEHNSRKQRREGNKNLYVEGNQESRKHLPFTFSVFLFAAYILRISNRLLFSRARKLRKKP